MPDPKDQASELLMRVVKSLLEWEDGVQDAKDYRQLIDEARRSIREASEAGITPLPWNYTSVATGEMDDA